MKNILKTKKGRFWLGVYLMGFLLLATIPCVYAEDNPITIINKLSDMIYQIIAAIGTIVLIMGIFQFGMSFKSQDSSQRTNGVLSIISGVIILCCQFILNYITK